MMELRHLRYMLALADHRSFTRASRAVHVTQSTLSHQIRQLELEVGFDLFDRSGREVVLTAAGEILLPGVRRALDELNGALRELNHGRQSQPVDICFLIGARGAARHIVKEVLCGRNHAGANLRVKIEEVRAEALAARLMDGEARHDIIVGDVQNLPAGWRFEPLYVEDIGMLLPPEHRFAGRRRVRVIELHNEPLALTAAPEPTRLIINESLRRVGAEPRVAMELNLVDPTLELALATGLATIAPRNLVPAIGMVYVPLEDPTPQRLVGFMWSPEAGVGAEVRAIVAALHNAAEVFARGKDPAFVIQSCHRPATNPASAAAETRQAGLRPALVA